MITHIRLEDMIAVVFTPFTKESEVNPEMTNHYTDWITSTTIQGILICGAIGEFSSLTIEERQQTLVRWIETFKHRFRIITHVRSSYQKGSTQLARHAAAYHTDAIAPIAPSFFEPGTVDDLVNYFKLVCGVAPETPFYYYNISSIAGVDLPANEFLTEGSKVIPSLVGVRFIHSSLTEMRQCINLENHLFEVLNGFGETLITGISTGTVAGVGSTYNRIPSVYQHVLDVMRKNNMAEARQW